VLAALGVIPFLVIGIFWIKVAGSRTGSILQSSVALFVQVLLGFGNYLIFGLRDDEVTYFFFAERTLDRFRIDPLTASSGFAEGKESFVWILAFLFALFGVSALPGLMMNAVFVASLPALFVWTGRNMGFFSSGRLTAWMVALAPPILLWGPGLKREAVVFLLLALFLLSLSLIYAKRWTWGLALAAIVSLALLTTRSSLLAVCAAGIVAMAVLKLSGRTYSCWPSQRFRHSVAMVLVATTVALIPAIIALTERALSSPTLSQVGVGIPELSDSSQATAVVNASWDVNSSFFGLTYNLLRSLVGPMPWEVTNPSLLFFWMEGMGYAVFLAITLLAFFRLPQLRGRMVVLWVTVAPLVLASALILANYGLNSRIRAHVFLLLILVVEPYLSSTLRSLKSPVARNDF